MSELKLVEGNDGPVLENGLVRVAVQLNRGTFGITSADGGVSVTAAATLVALSGGPSFTSRGAGLTFEGATAVEDAHGSGLALSLFREADEHEPEIRLAITVYDGQPFAVLQATLRNRARAAIRVQAFHVLDQGAVALGPAPSGQWRFYKEGWQDWSPALVLPVSQEDVPMAPPVIAPRTQPERKAGRFLSELMTVVAAPSGQSLLAGFTSAADQFSQVWLDRDTRTLTAASYADSIELPPGERLLSERLLVEPASAALAAMQQYGGGLAREARATPRPSPVSGWCSWYYYWQGVTEEAVLANLDLIDQRRRELPFDYVQIDDGYQAGIGDWLTANEKFPNGMRWMAGRIHERGFKAGLWLAPFLMGEESVLWKEHPDWAVQYNPGTPLVAMLNWGQRCFAIDLTRPEVIHWLESVFRTIFDEWRYDYVKIDFIYAGAVDGIRSDPNVTRAQAYRRGIETIRKVAGERFILGCGQPIGPSIGVVDGARIGPDVAPYWHPLGRTDERSDMSSVSTLNAIRNILSRFWMHDRIWLNDPDCLLARESETGMTLDEVRTLATVIGLSGGMVLDSDNLTRLTDERRELVSLLLPVYGKPAIPLDLFEADGMPQLFELDCGTHRLLGVFNWSDEPAPVRAPLPAEPAHVFDVWSRQYAGALTGSLRFTLPAHGCRLLAIRAAAARPLVVGSTFHLLQGVMELASEEWDGSSLGLRLRAVAKPEGELFVTAPETLGTPTADGVSIRQAALGLWALALRVDGEREVVLRFA